MTREEAAEILDNLIGMVEDNQENDYDEALKMAIKALNVPDTNVGDTIGRRDAIDALRYENIIDHMDTVYDSELHRCKRAIERILSQLPSAQPEIIRCEECVHNGTVDTDCPIYWGGKEYCSFGERWENT